MKANEAPDKLYFTSNENGTHYYTEGIPFEREYIEYTRTDAFIEKACNAYCKICKMPNCKGEDCKYIKGFRKYMKGE